MTPLSIYTSLKVVAYVVILSMVGTLAFAAVTALTNWSGIEV